jgi:hypothetical protein
MLRELLSPIFPTYICSSNFLIIHIAFCNIELQDMPHLNISSSCASRCMSCARTQQYNLTLGGLGSIPVRVTTAGFSLNTLVSQGAGIA